MLRNRNNFNLTKKILSPLQLKLRSPSPQPKMPPISVLSKENEDEAIKNNNLEINPNVSCDNLSITSVTKKITKMFEDNPIDFCSSGDTFDACNLYPSGIKTCN